MRTVHGILIASMTEYEKERWLLRYTELLVDAKRRNDQFAVELYQREVRRLMQP